MRVGFGRLQARAVLEPDLMRRVGFPGFELANHGTVFPRPVLRRRRLASVAPCFRARCRQAFHRCFNVRRLRHCAQTPKPTNPQTPNHRTLTS